MIDETEIEKTLIPGQLARIEATHELLNPPQSFEMFGWKLFSQITGGIRMNEFSILCGATGVGKTSLLANISANLLTQRVKHFVASVETGHTDFMNRVMSVVLDENLYDKNVHTQADVDRINDKTDFLFGASAPRSLWLSTIDNRMSMEFLIAKLQHAERLGCKVALLDNLNFFLDVKSAAETLVEMDKAVHELIMFCKRTAMHVVLVMHPRKTEGGRVESEFDIKGSSTAVQEAHNVFLFNRLAKEDIKAPQEMFYRELKIAKMRKRGKAVGVRLIFDGGFPSYREVDIR